MVNFQTMQKLAIVIVTYKRQELLDQLLESFLYSTKAPWRIFVIDNEHSSKTKQLVDIYARMAEEGITQVAWPNGAQTFSYVPMDSNTGGAGGFAAGVTRAYEEGAEWFWLMDDDVVTAPDAIEKLDKWADRFDVIQGSRLDFDGGPFFWQYHFVESLGIYDPFSTPAFPPSGFKEMNKLCFEGGLFNRSIVEAVGIPDARFFIYMDDCMFGYLACKAGRAAVVEDVILQRTRNIQNMGVGSVKQLNSSSNMTRYHVMRNRGHVAHYLKMQGDYNPVGFAVGTAATFAKEFIRLAFVEKKDLRRGFAHLVDGWLDARKIMADTTWKPAPKPHDILSPSPEIDTNGKEDNL